MPGKLDMVYGTVASFDMLMQSFYELQQITGEKVTKFVTRLEGVSLHEWITLGS